MERLLGNNVTRGKTIACGNSHPKGIHPSIALAHKCVYTQQPNEQDILSLCDLFLTPGMHYVTVTSIKEGRTVVNLFVDMLKCYHAVGFIDKVGKGSSQGMNLYELFAHYKDNLVLRDALNKFFLEEFDYDFIWIVYPKYSVAHTFIHIFLDQVIEFNVDQKIPIVFINT